MVAKYVLPALEVDCPWLEDDFWTFVLSGSHETFHAVRRNVRPGKATRPLRLPHKAPACFESQTQWDSYRPLAVVSGSNGFTYCTDCTPEYQGAMVAQGRCKYPKTTFKKTFSGIIVGRRKK